MSGYADEFRDGAMRGNARHDSDAERQRREEALRSLASGGQGGDMSTSRQTPLRAKLPKRPGRLVAILSAVALVAVVGVVLSHALLGSANGSASTKVIHRIFLDPTANGLDCPHDVSWAPDGARVAVVGYSSDCPNVAGPYIDGSGSLGVAGLVNIYDAATGRLVAHLSPDAQIKKTIIIPQVVLTYEQSQEKTLGVKITFYDINYTHVLWSPDGAQVGLTFTAFIPNGLPMPDANGEITFPVSLAEGLEVMSVADGSSRAFVHMLDGSAPAYPAYLEWDLQSGALVAPTPALTHSGPQYTVTPAQGYQWGAGGTLTPTGSLASSGASASPNSIGDPDGRTSFSLWQPGIASTQVATGQSSVAGVFNWTTDIAAWSPDGRYLAEGISIAGVVTGPQIVAPDSGSLASVGWSTAPQIPARDAALVAVEKIAQKQAFPAIVTERGSSAAPSGVLLAWRPNGTALAVDAASNDAHVTLLNTATGKSILTLQPLANPRFAHGPTEQNEANILRWSPDGSRLLLLDPSLETMTIWNLAGVAD
jgi:hypothetical protein